MARIPGRVDGRFLGVSTVDSAGEWNDLTAADLTTVTGEAIPATGAFIDLVVRETSGTNPCYLLLRASDAETVDSALMIAAGEARAFGLCFPDAAVSTISIYGEAKVEAGVL